MANNVVFKRGQLALLCGLLLAGCGGGGGGTSGNEGGSNQRNFTVRTDWPALTRALNLAKSVDLTLTNQTSGVAAHALVNRPAGNDAATSTSTLFRVPGSATYRLDVVAYYDRNGAGQVVGRRTIEGLNPSTASGISYNGVLPGYSLTLRGLPDVMHVGDPVQINIDAKDEDGQPFPLPAYPATQWTKVSTLAGTITQSGVFTPGEAGDHVVRLSVQDETGPVTFTVTLHVVD